MIVRENDKDDDQKKMISLGQKIIANLIDEHHRQTTIRERSVWLALVSTKQVQQF